MNRIYLEAAELIFDGATDYACNAIASLRIDSYTPETRDNHPEVKEFVNLFKPENTNLIGWGNEWGDTYNESKNCRILALCFMAEMS